MIDTETLLISNLLGRHFRAVMGSALDEHEGTAGAASSSTPKSLADIIRISAALGSSETTGNSGPRGSSSSSPHRSGSQGNLARGRASTKYSTHAFTAICATLDEAVEHWLRFAAGPHPERQNILDDICKTNLDQIIGLLQLGAQMLSPALYATVGYAIIQVSRTTSPGALARHAGELVVVLLGCLEDLTNEHGRPLRVAVRNILRTCGSKLFSMEAVHPPLFDWIANKIKIIASLEAAADLIDTVRGGVAMSRLSIVEQEDIRFVVACLDLMGHGKGSNWIGAEFVPAVKSIVEADYRIKAKTSARGREVTILEPQLIASIESFIHRFPLTVILSSATSKSMQQPTTGTAAATAAGGGGAAGGRGIVGSPVPAPSGSSADGGEPASKAYAEALKNSHMTHNDVQTFFVQKEKEYNAERSRLLAMLEAEERKSLALQRHHEDQLSELQRLTDEQGGDVTVLIRSLLNREESIKKEMAALSRSRQAEVNRLKEAFKKEGSAAATRPVE